MDKASTIFAVQGFKLQLSIVPNFPSLKKIVSDVANKIPKSMVADTESETLKDTVKKYSENNTLEDARDHFTKWADSTLGVLNNKDESEFESRSPRDLSKKTVTVSGKEFALPVACVNLIKGSKLAELIANGVPEGYATWSDLILITNQVANQVKAIIPTSARPKRERKSKGQAEAK